MNFLRIRRQIRALLILFFKDTIRNHKVILAAFIFPIAFLIGSVFLSSGGSDASFTVGKQSPYIFNNTEFGNTPLIPYVIDSPISTNIFTSQIFPIIASSFSSVQPNLTQFPSLASIVTYQQSINELYVHSSNSLPPRPVAGYEINQFNSSNESLDFGYTILVGSNPAIAPLLIRAMDMASQQLMLNTTGTQLSSFTIASKLVTFPAQAMEQLANSWGVPLGITFMSMGLSSLMTTFTIGIVTDRELGRRDLLNVIGVSDTIYFISVFIKDYIIFEILFIIFMSVAVTNVTGLSGTNALPIVLLGIFFGASEIWQSYFFALFFKSRNAVVITTSLFTAVINFLPYLVIQYAAGGQVPNWAIYIMTILAPASGLQRVLIAMAYAGILLTPYTAADTFDYNKPVLGVLLCLILSTVLSVSLIIIISRARTARFSFHNMFHYIFHRHDTRNEDAKDLTKPSSETNSAVNTEEAIIPTFTEDPTLIAEVERLQHNLNQTDDIIRLIGISKTFSVLGKSPVSVLSGLTLAVRRNECFGYLGPNGAGKTTTIRILTGADSPTSGMGFIASSPLFPFSPELAASIGVCPQFNVQWPLLSAREHLRIFAMLKGIPDNEIDNVADQIVKDMGLDEIKNKKVEVYSGGNARRLQLGLAIIGKPKVVFLDEPTTGVDVDIRRSIWDVINNLKKDSSIFLTTHSMEEAEALCDRIGIMVNGRLRALGTPQRLRNVYGEAYKIHLQIRTHRTVDGIVGVLQQEFPNCRVVQKLGTRVELEVAKIKENDKNGDQAILVNTLRFLGKLLGELEKIKRERKYELEDYSVGQPSLGQVFIDFAKKQTSYT